MLPDSSGSRRFSPSPHNPHYEEMCRRFLADSEDFSEENIARAGITRRFSNNGEFENCLNEVREAIVTGLC